MTPNPRGYAVGAVEPGSEWLTVYGSAHKSLRELLHPTRKAAEAVAERIRSRIWEPERVTVAYVEAVYHPGVTVTQTAFRIVEDALAKQRAIAHRIAVEEARP